MSIHAFLKSLQKLAVVLDDYKRRVSTDDILEMCKSICKSKIRKSMFSIVTTCRFFITPHNSVRTGGALFEMWLDLMGSYTSHRQLKSHLRDQPDQFLPDALEQEIVLREKVKFHGFVLSAIHNIGNTGKGQMFFLSFTARFHGLSNMGQDIISRYGFMMKPTLFLQERAQTLSDYDAQTR